MKYTCWVREEDYCDREVVEAYSASCAAEKFAEKFDQDSAGEVGVPPREWESDYDVFVLAEDEDEPEIFKIETEPRLHYYASKISPESGQK